MKKLSFEDMVFSRLSDAWCPVTGKAFSPNVPRIVPDKILSSIGDIPTYYKFPDTMQYVKYSNEVGCYTRAGSTQVFTDELDILEGTLTHLPAFNRGLCGSGLSEDGRPLEVFSYGNFSASDEVFLVTTLIHGNEADGVLGTLKAFELLCTHPDFAPLRDRYTIALLPCCNPDGYYLGQRNLTIMGPHPTGVPTGVNLNRVWPWFWTEFVPTGNESKGNAPISCSLESQAMEDFITSIPGGLPIAWALDQHATAGDGARYVSRDRNLRNLSEEDQEKIWANWIIFRLLRSLQARRVQEDAQPDLWPNYFRSRWRPHWHSYLSVRTPSVNGGIQAVSFVGEHNKVPGQVVTSDLETYQSASNYNFDHIISMALLSQGGLFNKKSAVLVEHEEGINQVNNANFSDWQSTEYRPGYWSGTRVDLTSSSRSEKHMADIGRPLRVSANVVNEMSDGWTGSSWDSDIQFVTGSSTVAVLAARTQVGAYVNGLGIYSWGLSNSPVRVFTDTGDSEDHQFRLGKSNLSSSVSLMCLGNVVEGQNAIFRSYELSGTTWSATDRATHGTPLEDAASVYDGNNCIYTFGGKTGSGAKTSKVYKADSSAWTFTEVGVNLLGTADSGMGACWCTGGSLDGKAVLVGGSHDGSSGIRVRIFDSTGPSITDYYTSAPSGCYNPPAVEYCGVVYDGTDSIYVYGGKKPSEDVIYSEVIKLTWSGSAFTSSLVSLLAGLSDDGDPEDYAGDEEWIRPFKYWRGIRTYDSELGISTNVLFGGLERLSDGSDDSDIDNRRGFWVHYISDGYVSRPADYDFGYVRYNTSFPVSGYTKAVTSWSYKSDLVGDAYASSAYVRLNNAPGDADAGIITTRRLRTYYLHPPQDWWWREHSALDISTARPRHNESVWRSYIRMYRQGQSVLIDSPMIQTGTRWPASWSPGGYTRAVEQASWSSAVDNRYYRLSFDWLPATSFLGLDSGELKLLSIGDDTANQRVELWAIGSDTNSREYYRGGVVGSNEPYLELRIIDTTTVNTVQIPVYWGGYVKDGAVGKFESPVGIQIWHHMKYGFGLSVRNGWSEGWGSVGEIFGSWSGIGDVKIFGGGWWAEPETLRIDKEWKKKYVDTEFPNGALLLGDRDPTFGQISYLSAFKYTENFQRSNSTNLGNNWRIIQQTGAGWDVYNNEARCSQLGIERWTSYPYIRDCALIADVVAYNGRKVGLCTRLHWGTAVDLIAHGYIAYLECTGATTADLVIERFYYDAGSQGSSVLNTQAITYTEGSTVTLTLEAIEDDITLTVSNGATGSVTVNDSNHNTPGAFGIYGATAGASDYVYLDNLRAEPRNGVKIRITE